MGRYQFHHFQEGVMFADHNSRQLAFSVMMVMVLLLSSVGVPAVAALGNTWYVATALAGGSDSNTCNAVDSPCASVNAAIAKAAAGDTIEVAIGTYWADTSAVAVINKNLTLSGGWSAGFASQTGMSTLDGMSTYQGIVVNSGMSAIVDHFVIQHGTMSGFGSGGGIANSGTLTINNSVVTNNASEDGGGISTGGNLTINNSTVSNNTGGKAGLSGGGGGGGLFIAGGTTTINNSTISGNQIVGGFDGAALYVQSPSTVNLRNTTVSGNGGGGVSAPYAIEVSGGTVVLNNSTVTGNAGGITQGFGTVTLRNSILAGNSWGGYPADCGGTVNSGGYNLVGVVASYGCSIIATDGDVIGTSAAPVDPKLGPLQGNGGPTFTHALLGGSPAIDGGNSTVEPGGAGPACMGTDQRGFPRPTLAQGFCDKGAFELQRPSVVSINRMDSDPTSAPTVRFSVTFTDPVTGVDATDFALTTPGVTGASVADVSGSGITYTVTVGTGSGAGTIRLDLIDDDSIQAVSSGNPLSGPGAGNGNFVGGQVYNIQPPHVVASVRADPSPTAAAAIHFTVTFSTAVTGVDPTAPFPDFALTTTGVTGQAITGVSGSGATYTVTVNPGTGPGTVRLDVVDDDTIVDTWGNKLGGTGTGNGNFTTGAVYDILQPPIVYVAPSGDDTNLCRSAGAPCLTINGGLGKAAAGDMVKVAVGTYYGSGAEVVAISKNITLSGGWDSSFAAQTGMATIDGQAARRGITVNSGRSLLLDHFVVQHGSASSFGGGIYSSGTLTVNQSVITQNASGWMGGGIDVYGSLTVNDSTISNNTAGQVGYSGGGGGGGIEVNGPSVATLNNTTLNGNQILGDFSGSAMDTNGTIYLNNVTVSGNTGTYALSTIGGQLILNNTTVTANTGGVDNGGAVTSLRNSILAGNGSDCTGTIGSGGYNLVGAISGCTFMAMTGDRVGSVAAPIDPMLGPLQDNGGPTFTHALLPGSPAIDAGNPDAPGLGGNACLAADQRRITRPQGTACDSGAFELVQYEISGYEISGNVGLASATLSYRDGIDKTVTTDASGNYSFLVSAGWSGTVTPSQTGYAFIPSSRSYTNISHDQTLQNYVAHVLLTSTIRSTGAHDGWVLETGEKTRAGGAINATDPTFMLGDDAARKQYRAILSFKTGSLPDNAVITNATLSLVRKTTAPTGTNPFKIFQGLLVDIRQGFFGSSAALQAADFQARASQSGLGPYNPTPAAKVYAFSLPSAAFPYINTGIAYRGLTQLRLGFKLDDNNNSIANTISFYSGNSLTASYRPVLTIEYFLP